jgi:(1->4)-alpha-D-glucan 1-alpha-D-glucosylmutase
VYQGCELWDLSFVDPDNRRPVDFDKRMEFLFQLVVREEKGSEGLLQYLKEHREEGIEKLYITWKVLNFRKKKPDIFVEGRYVAMAITGKDTRAAAYARVHNGTWVLVVFPFGLVRHEMEITEANEQYLVLPEDAPETWQNLLTQEIVRGPNQIAINDILRTFPVAVLVAEKRT